MAQPMPPMHLRSTTGSRNTLSTQPIPQQPNGSPVANTQQVAEERAQVVLNYQDRVVTLNVGGIKYQSTWETLCHSGLFGALLKYKFDKEDIFIDREGGAFKHILCFLRAISAQMFSRSFALSIIEHLPYEERLLLMLEADYYQIPTLSGVLKSITLG